MKVMLTGDGSHTIYSEQFDEIYHSRHGAITESEHVFIRSGLSTIDKSTINVFEVGFGTGLNALLTWIYAEKKSYQNDIGTKMSAVLPSPWERGGGEDVLIKSLNINYTAIELYLVSEALLSEINYPSLFSEHSSAFRSLHEAEWERRAAISPFFSLQKLNRSLLDFSLPTSSQDVIYFDAFSPDKQPELWSVGVFRRMYDLLTDGGILVTYCSKSMVRKNMKEAGFDVGKLPGPPGKREMVRAIKKLL